MAEDRARPIPRRRVSASGFPRRRHARGRRRRWPARRSRASSTRAICSARAMRSRPVRWTYSRSPVFGARRRSLNQVSRRSLRVRRLLRRRRASGVRRARRRRRATLDAERAADARSRHQAERRLPYQYTLEGDVEDVSRQHIAGRASFVVHPAPWYIGLQRPSLFVEQKDGLSTSCRRGRLRRNSRSPA